MASEKSLSPKDENSSSFGCSFWPDRWLLGNTHECCVVHDIMYGAGGTEEVRKLADSMLYDCVRIEHSRTMAFGMWSAVRMVGWNFFNYQGVGYEEVDVCPSDTTKSTVESPFG